MTGLVVWPLLSSMRSRRTTELLQRPANLSLLDTADHLRLWLLRSGSRQRRNPRENIRVWVISATRCVSTRRS